MVIKIVLIALDLLVWVYLLVDPGIVSIVLAAIAAVVSIGTLWFQYKTNTKMKEQTTQLSEVRKQIDGQQDMLLAATSAQNKAEGKLETKDELIEVLKHTEPIKNDNDKDV